MLFCPAELTHTTEKFEFTTKEFGARWTIRSPRRVPLRRLRGGGQSARSNLNVIGWRHTVEYGSPQTCFYTLLFCDTYYLVAEIISVSEKRMKNCIVKIINNVLEKMTKVGYFL